MIDNPIIIKTLQFLVAPLMGTFTGAVLAFWSQSYREQVKKENDHKDTIIETYHINLVNLRTLLTFKNMFLADFSEEFNSVKSFCEKYTNEYINGITPVRQLRYQLLWKEKYYKIFYSLISGKTRGPTLLKVRWEIPNIIFNDLNNIKFITKHNREILDVFTLFESTIDSIKQELLQRDLAAKKISSFDTSQMYNADPEYIKNIYLLLIDTEGIIDLTDRALALSTGLVSMLETHYLKTYGEPDFGVIKFSKENLELLPNLEKYTNFLGSKDNMYTVKTRLSYTRNTLNKHRELNLPTHTLPEALL